MFGLEGGDLAKTISTGDQTWIVFDDRRLACLESKVVIKSLFGVIYVTQKIFFNSFDISVFYTLQQLVIIQSLGRRFKCGKIWLR